MNLDSSEFDDWILGGDFNLIRQPENRNKPGGDLSEMNMFNEAISDLDLVDIPFSGRSYTWSNMQANPLLVKLDWIFTSSTWTLSYPATYVQPLSKPVSDHIPYVLHIGSCIPKSNLFRFENFWTDHRDFLKTVELHWNNSAVFADATRNLSSKLKQVRAGLRKWSKGFSKLSKLIYNSNWVLLLLDGLEDQRPLSKLENAFRKLVQNHLSSLLESKRKYWKQRNTIRWVNLGDENTSFFHTVATISHKRNFIVSLTKADGSIVIDHEQKASLLWTSYKERLGVSNFTNISFNLNDLLTMQNLEHLDAEFSPEEIDRVIKTLPNSHAPGPDGFNDLFIKKSWPIIMNDFMRFFNDFYHFNTNLSSVNSSLIALVPKKMHPETVDDYRPISLLNYTLKCITKLLSNRVQSVILQLVHANQYGFIKGRTIQDCLAWAFQFLHLCHHSKKEIVILKIDFEKAFDKIEHEVILQVLRHKGFSEKWVN